MEFVFVVLFGIALGSFGNVLIFRIPKNISIVMPSSFCPKCKKSLQWRDKIPIFSYVFLRGKSRCCGNWIPFWYCLSEILGGIFALFSFYYYGIFGIVCFLLLLNFYVLSVIDWQFFEIPDSLNFLNLAFAVVFGGLFGEAKWLLDSWVESFVCAFLFMGIASFLRLFVGSIFKKEVLGEGDIIVFGALGASLGIFGGSLATLFASGYALVFMLFARKSLVPFVPFLFIGFLSVMGLMSLKFL
ncbi:prepilin peptidase [Helicobacter pullorum]